MKQYREFVAKERKRNPSAIKENDRKRRQAVIPAHLLNFGQDLAMEKKWMQAYYPGAWQSPIVSTECTEYFLSWSHTN